MVWNLFPLEVILVLGKTRGCRVPNLGCMGWFDVLPKSCMRCDVWMDILSWWSCQSPVAHSCGLLNRPNSLHGGMFKLNTKFDADSLLIHYSIVILNATATQYTCSLSGVHHPHWLVQGSHHCSCMGIPVHSPWLPGYINALQTILVIVTMAGFFPRQIIYIHINLYI